MNSLEAIEKLRIGHEQEAQQCIEIFRSFCQWYQSQYNFEQIESTFWNACIYLIEKHDLSEEKLIDYLAKLKAKRVDPRSEKSQAFREFTRLLYHAKQIIAGLYQHDEEEKGGDKVWTAERITPSDVEKVICSGIPINKMGNLKKMSASILAKHFSQKRFSRQRITNILSHKLPVERFDLITLEFFIVSQEMEDDDPFNRYKHFLDEIQDILLRCGMGEIYIVNPYECFLLMCLLTDCPLAVFSEIWEKSYEEGEAEEA